MPTHSSSLKTARSSLGLSSAFVFLNEYILYSYLLIIDALLIERNSFFCVPYFCFYIISLVLHNQDFVIGLYPQLPFCVKACIPLLLVE